MEHCPADSERIDGVRRLALRMAGAARITVVTGAGVSAASGVPTFRGAGGLWRNFRPEELATPEAFARDPRTVWEWYDMRRRSIAAALPNAAHEVISAWSRRFDRFVLVTQNVDGLDEQAGTRGVVRFHGSIWRLRCFDRCGGAPEEWEDRRAPLAEIPPRCPSCGGLARPGVVWFGEMIPAEALAATREALDCDVCLVVGTSSLVMPAAGLVDEARRRGAWTAEVNLEATPASSRVDLAIAGRAEEVLPEVDRRLRCAPPPTA
jgi:NAD-dependent deacetylase